MIVSALLLSCLLQTGDAPVSPAVTTSITHVRVIDGTGQAPREDMTLILRDGKIAAVAPSAGVHPEGKVIDGRGKTVMPGIINAHGHLALVNPDAPGGPRVIAGYYTRDHMLTELRQYERFGVTSLLSLGLNRDLVYGVRTEQQAGTLDGAQVYVADRGLGVLNGAPPVKVAPDQLYRPTTTEEARQDVDAAVGRHTDYIKIWVDSLYHTVPEMSTAIYQAVIAEAHLHQTPVAAHVFYLADAKELVTSGINVLAHSVRDFPLDQPFLDTVKLHGTFYIPTLTVDESFFAYADQPAWLDDPLLVAAAGPQVYALITSQQYRDRTLNDPETGHHRVDHAAAEMNLRLALAGGVKIAFGTDSGANPYRIPGWAEHHELAMMVESGLTPLQAIHAATQTNAQLLSIDSQTGSIAPGLSADILLLAANPLDDIHNTEKIVAIWHKGRFVQPGVPAQPLIAR